MGAGIKFNGKITKNCFVYNFVNFQYFLMIFESVILAWNEEGDGDEKEGG